MPTEEQIQTRQWAEQALRKGRAREALELYRKLLKHDKTEGRHYEAWLDGTAAAYLALGRGREAGYVLLALGRYGGGAAALSRQGAAAGMGAVRGAHGPARRGGARVLRDRATRRWPRSSWRRRARRPRRAWNGSGCCATSGWPAGRTRPRWRTSAWARRCCASAIARAACASWARRRACWRSSPTISRPAARPSARSTATGSCCGWGRTSGSFETVAEGYLNMIRIIVDPTTRNGRVQYYDDFIALRGREQGVVRGGDGGARGGRIQPADRRWSTIVTTWSARPSCGSRRRTPTRRRTDRSICRPTRFQAAIDAATALGDLALAGRIYGELAELPLARCAPAALPRAGAPLRIGAAPAAPGAGVPGGDARAGQLQGHLAATT